MRRRGRRKDEAGQALVEFAIVVPLLLMVLFAIVELGIAFNHYLSLTDAVRAGARKASVSRTAVDPEEAARDAVVAAASDLDVKRLDVNVDSQWRPGSDVTVTARYPYSLQIFGIEVKSGNLISKTTERVE